MDLRHPAIIELVKLQRMVNTATDGMEEPDLPIRMTWDAHTASYVEELEGILTSLSEQSINCLLAIYGEKR